jgi:hypothetical protein
VWSAVFNARGKYETVLVFARFGASAVAEVKNNAGRSPLDFARQIKDSTLERTLTAS